MTEKPDSPRVVALFVSPGKGQPMQPRLEVEARAGHGFAADAHARPGTPRQVLLLDTETLEELNLTRGILKENITTRGLTLATLARGTRLQAGQALIEITKECAPCAQWNTLRPGLEQELRGRRGMLARVVTGGLIRLGDSIRLL